MAIQILSPISAAASPNVPFWGDDLYSFSYGIWCGGPYTVAAASSLANNSLQFYDAAGAILAYFRADIGLGAIEVIAPTLTGSTASGGNLAIRSTSHATKGKTDIGAVLYVDEVNGRIGVNVASPAVLVQGVNPSGTASFRFDAYGATAGVQAAASFFRSRGTPGSESGVLNNDSVATLNFGGAHSGGAIVTTSRILVKAAQDWTSGALGTTFAIQTCIVGASAMADRMLIDGAGDVTWANGLNFIFATTTGTKIATATTQKLGFWNAAPIAQPASTGQTAGHTAGAGAAVDAASTFTGGSGTKAYTIGDIVKHLKAMGLLASS